MTGLILLLIYALLFVGAYLAVRYIRGFRHARQGYGSLKTVTFGDESSVIPDRAASVLSVLVIFFIWGAATGSKWVPLHVPGPFIGQTSFTYTGVNGAGETGSATVFVTVHEVGAKVDPRPVGESGAVVSDDSAVVGAWRSVLVRVTRNDQKDVRVTHVDGRPVSAGQEVSVADGMVSMTPKGSLKFTPDKGWQMEPIWLPSPDAVVARLVSIYRDGYQNFSLAQHLGWSLTRVVVGFLAGALVGIPLGYAMGLFSWTRGWFDPIVEFMRPVPPLALIPLVIIWFGIWETGKIVLLFLAALWIMTIAARAGVSGVNITKVHAAYSLGANRWQVLRHVIVPNSLPEIFTGARVAMGVCWGTVVAAELVAAQKGAGMMIIAASKFQLTDIVIMGIVLIGIIGYGIDILMRMAEKALVPWKGRS